jgi:hypothetical protein
MKNNYIEVLETCISYFLNVECYDWIMRTLSEAPSMQNISVNNWNILKRKETEIKMKGRKGN